MKRYIFPTVIIASIVLLFVGMIYLQGRNSSESVQPSTLSSLLNKPALPFNLKDRNGNEYNLETLKGKNVILFFNEGIMCYPACWNQVAAFGKDPRFNSSDTVALSVVVDKKGDWDYAIQKMPELDKATILLDTTKSASMSYGMLTLSSSMHYGSLPGHTYVIIDKQGIIRYVLDDPNMALNNDLIYAETQKLNK